MFGTFQEKNWGISFMLKAVAISVDSKKLELYENRLQDLNLQEEPFADLDNNGFLKKLWKIHRKTHDSKSPSNKLMSLIYYHIRQYCLDNIGDFITNFENILSVR